MTPQLTSPPAAGATAPNKPPVSRWWPIGLLIVWPVLLVIGAMLLGIGQTAFRVAGFGMYKAGVALMAIGGAVKIAYWALVIVRHRQRRRCPVPPPIERPLSKWWLIGLSIPCFVLIVAGVTLIGVGIGSYNPGFVYYSYGPPVATVDTEENFIMTWTGFACLAIGLGLKMAFWAVVNVRQRQKRRARLAMPPMHPYSGAPPAIPAPGFQIAPAPPGTAPYATQQQPSSYIAGVSGQHLVPSPTEVSGQHRILELSPTPTSTATAELGAQERYATEPSSTAAELPMPASHLEPAATPPQPQAPPQVFLVEREAAPSAQKERTAKFCKYCGGAVDAVTKCCGQCGV